MSQYFIQAAYAEDQTNAHTILHTHVLYRGFQTGAVVGIGIGLFRARRLLFSAARSTKPSTVSADKSKGTNFLGISEAC